MFIELLNKDKIPFDCMLLFEEYHNERCVVEVVYTRWSYIQDYCRVEKILTIVLESSPLIQIQLHIEILI